MRTPSILVVDDDRAGTEYLLITLRDEGYQARGAGNGVEALVAMETEPFDLVLADLHMPEMGGLELLTHVHERWPAIPVILMTVDDDVPKVVEAMHQGAVNYLVKPFPPPVLREAVAKALRARVQELPASPTPSEILGVSKGIVEVRHLVTMAARTDVNVLISGETGTGKELVARTIHNRSSLQGKPFVAANCAAIPPDLFESTFFGHRQGAFTGASHNQEGLLVRADGGILFLDELECMPHDHQAKLLRVLDDGEVRPLGTTEVRHVSVRFLAATNRDPRELLRRGTLREDLYYRLRGFEIHLLPLRERKVDIPILAAHFLAGEEVRFTAEALDALQACEWPGNVRQLQNVVRSSRALATGGVIGARHLDLPTGVSAGPAPAPGGVEESGGLSLRENERRVIEKALRWFHGNRTLAAKALGIDRSTLRRKLKEFGIDGSKEEP